MAPPRSRESLHHADSHDFGAAALALADGRSFVHRTRRQRSQVGAPVL